MMDANVIIGCAPTVPEIDQLSSILTWIGFTNAPERIAITTNAFTTYDDLLSLKEKDITGLSEAFSCHTTNNGKINFCVRRTMKLKWRVHWTQHFYWISERPCVDGLNKPLSDRVDGCW